jgi:hypothetical protein
VARISARIGQPCFAATASLAISVIAAPSDNAEAFAAVTVPSFFKHRRQSGDLFERSIRAHGFVFADRAASGVDRDDLVGERAAFHGR